MAQTNSNGARAKILRALITEGMLTTGELAQQTGMTGEQARDNANAAAACGLIVKGNDYVTGFLGYHVTPLGRQWVNDQVQKACALLSATTGSETVQPGQEAGAEPIAEMSQALNDYATADLDKRRSYIAELGKMDSTTVHQINATEPAQPPEQYAICRAGQGHLSAWPLRDMTIDAARQLAIDDAAAIGGEVVLYRCVPIGKAFPRIVFEEA